MEVRGVAAAVVAVAPVAVGEAGAEREDGVADFELCGREACCFHDAAARGGAEAASLGVDAKA